jgi:hypothetical protein
MNLIGPHVHDSGVKLTIWLLKLLMMYYVFYVSDYNKGKFAIGHCYFLAFAETHCSIVSLPGTITIL